MVCAPIAIELSRSTDQCQDILCNVIRVGPVNNMVTCCPIGNVDYTALVSHACDPAGSNIVSADGSARSIQDFSSLELICAGIKGPVNNLSVLSVGQHVDDFRAIVDCSAGKDVGAVIDLDRPRKIAAFVGKSAGCGPIRI